MEGLDFYVTRKTVMLAFMLIIIAMRRHMMELLNPHLPGTNKGVFHFEEHGLIRS